jgi:hypothetical protein
MVLKRYHELGELIEYNRSNPTLKVEQVDPGVIHFSTEGGGWLSYKDIRNEGATLRIIMGLELYKFGKYNVPKKKRAAPSVDGGVASSSKFARL